MPEAGNSIGDAMSAVARALEEAQELHQSGRLDQAEAMYREVLAKAPGEVVAMHLLGALLNQRRNHAEAAEVLGRVLELNARSPLAHLHLGNALWGLDRTQEALAHFQHALRFNPELPDALLNCAVLLSAMGRNAEALARLEKLITLRPQSAEAHLNRGVVLQRLKRGEEALQSYDLALSFSPDHPDALTNRGNALLDLDRPEEALACYDHALALQPGHQAAAENRANPLLHSRIAVLARLQEFRDDGTGTKIDSGIAGPKKVLFLLPLFGTGMDGDCGEYPLESDLCFHFEQSFRTLGFCIIKPNWNYRSGRIFIDMEDLSKLLDEHSFDYCIMEINYDTSEEHLSTVWYKNKELIKKLKRNGCCVISFIGDAYPRGRIAEVIQSAHDVSTIVWCPYPGAKGMLQFINRRDLLDKFDTTPIFPTVFTESFFTRFPEKRPYEISYLGSSKRIRLNAVAEFCRIDNLQIFVNTTTRDYNSLNDSKPMKYFLDVLESSVATITSTARSPDNLDTEFERIQAKFPEVFSGRFMEAISRGCMPIYIAKDSHDFPPLPDLQQGVHYFRIEHVHEYFTTLQAIRGLDRSTAIRALRDYHAAHLSPEAVLAPLLARGVKLAAESR